MDQAVGCEGRKWGGGGNVLVEDLHGDFVDYAEVGSDILQEVQIRFHGLGIMVVDGGQFEDVVLLGGILEQGG